MPKVLLWNNKANAAEAVPPERIRAALDSGDYTEFSEGQTEFASGSASVPTELGARGGEAIDRILLGNPAQADPATAASAQAGVDRDAAFSGLGDYVQAGREGVLQGLTFGLIEGQGGYEGEARREARGGTVSLGRLAASVGSAFIPGTAGYALAKGAASAGKATAAALGAGRAARVAGSGVEGALFGVADETAHQLVDVALRDKPFVAERLASAGLLGGLTNAGLTGIFEVGSAAVARAEAAKGLADEAARKVTAPSPGLEVLTKELNEFTASHEAVRRAILPKEQHKLVARQVTEVADSFDEAVSQHVANLTMLRTFKEDAARKVGVLSAEDRLVTSLDDKWFTERFNQADEAIAAGEKLKRWNKARVVDLDADGYRAFVDDWLDYEKKVAALDDQIHLPPEPRASAPLSKEAEVRSREGTQAGKGAKRKGTRPIDEAAPAPPAAPAGVAPSDTSPFGLPSYLEGWTKRSRSRLPAASERVDDIYGVGGSYEGYAALPGVERRVKDVVSGKLLSAAEELASSGGLPGGVPGVTATLKAERRGESNLIDALTDVWSVNTFAKGAADEARGRISALRKAMREERALAAAEPLADSAEAGPRGYDYFSGSLARYAAHRAIGGAAGFAVGQAAFGLVAGRVGRLAAWADQAKLDAANAAVALLGGGRPSAVTKGLTSAKVSYTGNPEDATDEPARKGEQLRAMVSNEDALRARLRKALAPVAKASPDLAIAMEDAQINQMRNLSIRAPAFLLVPGAVPKRPGPADRAFEQYEAITHDPGLFIQSLKSASVTRPMVDAYREQHPEQYKHLVGEVLKGLTPEKVRKLPLATKRQIELVIGGPLGPSVGPAQQLLYQRSRQDGQSLPDGGPPNPRAVPRASQGSQLTSPLIRPGAQ